MENLEWYPVYYNGLETNVEVTKTGRVRKVKVDWYGNTRGAYQIKIGEVDFSNLELSRGYKCLKIQIKGLKAKTQQVHRLIASAFLGYKFQGNKIVVDHIDSNKLNNDLQNLRIITARENSSKERTIKSGLPVGVVFLKNQNVYQSQILINKKRYYLGRYKTIEEASNAYQNKLKQTL